METQNQAKSKLKRQHDNDGNEQRKNQRLILAAAKPEHTTKIIDLNDDCLVKMFGYLDLQSLFNVAVANEWLRPAAREVYKRKFGKIQVHIQRCDDFHPKTRANARKADNDDANARFKIYNWFNEIDIYGLKTCLLYLRCFGPSITELWIDYNKSKSKRYNYVCQYINDYCTENLTHILFERMPNISFDEFQTVVGNVKVLTVLDTVLKQHLQSLVEWFPNLSCLKLRHVQCGVQNLIGEPLQQLEHLTVVNLRGCNLNGFVADLLRGAHQLKTMEIEIFGEQEFSIEKLLDMIKDKPLLAQFTYEAWEMCRPMPVDAAAVQCIIKDHPVELDLPQYLFSHDGINALIGQLNSLKKFRFLMRESDFHDLVSQLDIKKWHATHYDPWQFNNDFITLASFYRKK